MFGSAIKGALFRARKFSWQFKDGRSALENFLPVVEFFAERLAGEEIMLPVREVGVLDGEFGKVGGAFVDELFVGGKNLADDNASGPAIRNDVVKRDEQDVFLGGQASEAKADEWAVFEIEGSASFLFAQLLKAGFGIGGEVGEVHRNGGAGCDDLLRDGIYLAEGGAECFVPVNEISEGAMKRDGVERAADAETERNIIGAAFWVELRKEPKPLLGKA